MRQKSQSPGRQGPLRGASPAFPRVQVAPGSSPPLRFLCTREVTPQPRARPNEGTTPSRERSPSSRTNTGAGGGAGSRGGSELIQCAPPGWGPQGPSQRSWSAQKTGMGPQGGRLPQRGLRRISPPSNLLLREPGASPRPPRTHPSPPASRRTDSEPAPAQAQTVTDPGAGAQSDAPGAVGVT